MCKSGLYQATDGSFILSNAKFMKRMVKITEMNKGWRTALGQTMRRSVTTFRPKVTREETECQVLESVAVG